MFGRECRAKGEPEQVMVHDFVVPDIWQGHSRTACEDLMFATKAGSAWGSLKTRLNSQ